MTKRYSYFKSELTDLFVISDELHKETFSGIDDEYNCSRIVRKLNTLTDENEQLKQFKEDVFNKIDMHLRMLPTVRDNEFNGEYGDPSLYTGAIYMLETLKKELSE